METSQFICHPWKTVRFISYGFGIPAPNSSPHSFGKAQTAGMWLEEGGGHIWAGVTRVCVPVHPHSQNSQLGMLPHGWVPLWRV